MVFATEKQKAEKTFLGSLFLTMTLRPLLQTTMNASRSFYQRSLFQRASRFTGQHSFRRWYHEVSFATAGEPVDVLEYHRLARFLDDTDDPPSREPWVNISMRHVPWNPADIFTVQGRYPSPYPPDHDYRSLRQSRFMTDRTVAGSEGWGRVSEVVHGQDVECPLQIGDWVALGQPSLGSFRSSLWLPLDAVVPIARGAELAGTLGPAAATLFQLGGTALGLIREFVDLKPGDVVIQNAGNSAVAIMVSQLVAALHQDVPVVSIVRRGAKTASQWDELTEYLTGTGKVSMVVAKESLTDNRTAVAELKNQMLSSLSVRLPCLALNAVGDASSNAMLQLLGHGGTHVTYGGLPRTPVTVASPQLIFKDVRMRGYWHSARMIEKTLDARTLMTNELVDLELDGQLQCPPVEVFPLGEILHGIDCATQQCKKAIRSKIVFDCQEPE